MSKKLLLAILAIATTGALLHAEEMKSAAPMEVNEIVVVRPQISPEMIRYAVSHKRREVFEVALSDLITDGAVKSAFWDVYNAYEAEKAAVADMRMSNVAEYVNNFTSMSDVKVKELLKSAYKTQSKELKIRNKYAKQLAKKTNPTIAGRFWQVDDFISSAVKISLLANVPLLGEEIY